MIGFGVDYECSKTCFLFHNGCFYYSTGKIFLEDLKPELNVFFFIVEE